MEAAESFEVLVYTYHTAQLVYV